MDTYLNIFNERQKLLERLIKQRSISVSELTETEILRAEELVEMKLATKELGTYFYGVPDQAEIKRPPEGGLIQGRTENAKGSKRA